MSFDQKAKDWDNDPKKLKRASDFAREIIDFLPYIAENTALEIGCGTGLLSFLLKDQFQKIHLTDTSKGMLEVLQEKITSQNITHFEPHYGDIIQDQVKLPAVNVIYTMMTLHHIEDLSLAFQKFYTLLLPDGYICIADLVTEDGSFHGPYPDFIHFGFDKTDLEQLMQQNGFKPVYYSECHIIEKMVNDEPKQFPLFLMIGKKE